MKTHRLANLTMFINRLINKTYYSLKLLCCLLVLCLITFYNRDYNPRNVIGDRYYKWGEPKNKDKPLPDVLELKVGSYGSFSKNEEAEPYMSTYRIERSFVPNPPETWNRPIKLHVPLAVLDKKLAVEEYIKQYQSNQHQTNHPYLIFWLEPTFTHDKVFDPKNWQTWDDKWHKMKNDVFHHKATCKPQFNQQHNYYFCDYFITNNNLSQRRYYWTNNPTNIDPLLKQPVIAQCSNAFQLENCTIYIGYDNSTKIFISGLSDTMETTNSGWQKNVFLYIDYMPKIIEFLNERKVD